MFRSLLLLSILFALSFSASGKEIYVNSVTGVDITGCGCSTKPCLTIPYALEIAQADDLLILQGHFRLTSSISLNKNVGLSGGQNTNSNYPAILDCGKRDQSAIFIGKSVKTSLSNLVIQNCFSHSASAVEIFSADVVLNRVTFKNNKRWRGNGGALSIFGGKVDIRSSVFQSNFAMVQNGGAIACTHGCQLNLVDSLVIENEAKNAAGGVFLSHASHLVAQRTTFGGNTAKTAGGILAILGSSVTGKECKFEENVATAQQCSQVLLKTSEAPSSFSSTTFVSASSSSSSDSSEKGVCLEKSNIRFTESSFVGVGISCSNSEFDLEESKFFESPEGPTVSGTLPVACGHCSGWVGKQKICRRV